MKAELTESGCTLRRESGDARIYHESTVVSRMREALNAQGYRFRRIYPDRCGLTACRLGLRDAQRKIILWHERYAIEDARQEFNHGEVWFQRVNE